MSKELTVMLPEKLEKVAESLTLAIGNVTNNNTIDGFKRAYLVADAIDKLKILLTTEYMKPIMSLQGNKLGFKTDKDDKGGYPEAVVKNCLIEAVLIGLQPHSNQFNIIAGQMYATKEGVGHLLSKIRGLDYKIIADLPRIKEGSAAVVMHIEYKYNNIQTIESLDIPVKVNQYMGTDAVIGKATRKARKWLFDRLTGSELPEGDVTDIEFREVKSEKTTKETLKEGQQGKIELP